VVCPKCGGTFAESEDSLMCSVCGTEVPIDQGIPLFTPVPTNIVPSTRGIIKGPNDGSLWRRANWAFYERMMNGVQPDQIVLDVGAGQAHFKQIFRDVTYVAVDIYPYDNVDFVCDLTKTNPLRPASVDIIVLSNVLEHVLEGKELLQILRLALKPGGQLLIAVPFMIGVHQAPFDFIRYTNFALSMMLTETGFDVTRFEAVSGPLELVQSTVIHSRGTRRSHSGLRDLFDRVLLRMLLVLVSNVGRFKIWNEPVVDEICDGQGGNASPLGYQIKARKSSA